MTPPMIMTTKMTADRADAGQIKDGVRGHRVGGAPACGEGRAGLARAGAGSGS